MTSAQRRGIGRRAAHAQRARRTRVPGAAGLAARQAVVDPWVTLLLAALVALVACLATLWPRVVLDMNSRQVPHVLEPLSVTQRDVIAVVTRTQQPEPSTQHDTVEGTWGPLIDGMETVRQAQPEPLRSLLEPGQFLVDLGQPLTFTEAPDPDSDIAQFTMQQRIDPWLTDHVELVQGDWPAMVMNMDDFGWLSDDGTSPDLAEYQEGPVEVVMADSAAQRLGWQVGETVLNVTLSGTYRVLDPDDPRWQHSTNAVDIGTFFDGNLGTIGSVTAYLPAANPGTTGAPTSNMIRLWYGLDGSAVTGEDVDPIVAQLTGMGSRLHTVQPARTEQRGDEEVEVGQALQASFSTEALDTFRDLSTGQRASAAILAVVAAGPVGVVLATFLLGARLIVARRGTSLAVAAARGGSAAQIRGLLALEGLVVGLPAAALGYAAAGLVVPRSTGPAEWVVAAVVGLVPALALALTSGERSLRESRADLGARSRSRLRWIAEVAVLALAAIAVWRLMDRGLVGVTPEEPTSPPPAAAGAAGVEGVGPTVTPGVDLLMAATPVLLALAACLVTLRLYPVPVNALVSVFRRRSGLISFLGAARAVRDPAGGLLPALTVILGVAVAVFSSVMTSTITDGAERSAWNANGAHLRLSGPWMDEQLVQAIREVEGVGEVAVVSRWGSTADLQGATSAKGVTVYVVDSTLAAVQTAAPLVDALPGAVFGASGATPIVTGGAISGSSGSATLTNVGPVEVVGHVEELPGARSGRSFVVLDRAAWEAAGKETTTGTLALLSVENPAQVEQVAEELRAAVPNALIDTPRAQLDTFRSAPLTSGLTRMFAAAVMVTTGLTVLAIVIVQLMGAPARARLLAVLRTLGLAPRQGRGLTAWELAPLLAAAFLVGAVVGLAIPWLLLRAIDLTGMTGGQRQPALTVDWAVLGPVLAGILVAVTVAVTVSSAVAARTDLARQLRIGTEG